MITLKQWFETVNYRITEGSDYTWGCYGSEAHSLSAWNGEHGVGGWSANIVFDTQNQTVFEVDVCDYTHNRAYRVINPAYRKQYDSEAATRGEYANQAWDNVDYTDLEADEDWLDKAAAIVAGRNYDTRVSIPVEFTDEELLKYMTMAHERDMTFNQLIEEALRQAIDEHNRDPETFKARAEKWVKEHDADC